MPIVTKGFDEVSRKLGSLIKFEQWATPAVEEGVEAMAKEARRYAPDFAGNTYQRTGRLKASMEELIRATGSGVVGTVYSTGARSPRGGFYEHFVKVEGSQAQVHASHGWKTDVDDLEAARETIDRALDKAVKRVLR